MVIIFIYKNKIPVFIIGTHDITYSPEYHNVYVAGLCIVSFIYSTVKLLETFQKGFFASFEYSLSCTHSLKCKTPSIAA